MGAQEFPEKGLTMTGVARWPRAGAIGLGVAGLLVATLLVAPSGWAAEADESGAARPRHSVSEQDRQLIDGALFGVGPVARQLGTSIETVVSHNDLDRIENYAHEVREGLLATRESQVEQAVEDVRSGSVNRVDSGFRSLGAAFNEYIEETYTTEELQEAAEAVSSASVVPKCGAVAICVAAVAVALYAGVVAHNAAALTAAAAVLVSVYAWCGAWVGCGRDLDATGVDRVQREKFLANATRVASALPR